MPDSLMHGPPAITVDVEDWRQSAWDRSLEISQRAGDNFAHLLDLLDRLDVRATLFVLGKFAAVHPGLIKTAAAAGHEIACHGDSHEDIFNQTPAEFRADIMAAKNRLEQLIGAQVMGYRAPDFSIVSTTYWALEVLADSGFAYDSSIFPVDRPRYGIPTWPRQPLRVELGGGRSIVEFPIGVYRLWGKNWPIGGGGYHRLLPGPVARLLARRSMLKQPFVFYCHPYEFDPREFGALPFSVPLKTRLHQGLGRGRFERRFEQFVQTFSGRRLIDLYREGGWESRTLDTLIAAAS